MHRFFWAGEAADRLDDDCRSARIGCVDRKRALAESIIARYGDIAERSLHYRDNPDSVISILGQGSARARQEAAKTMAEVRRAIKLDWA
jgi:tryptophanyl-tRNA synthetase